MDRSWMYNTDRISDVFQKELQLFLNIAFSHASDGGLIRCPCYDCVGRPWLTPEEVSYHITRNGFQSKYYVWYHNGESGQVNEGIETSEGLGMEHLIHDRFHFMSHQNMDT